MRTLLMMFFFLVAHTSFCMAGFINRKESKRIVQKGTLVGEWLADGGPAAY